MNQFCERKGIKREFSVARTPQQNGIVEKKNSTLIEAARTMLADSKLPTTFWAEAVNTACYVQNRVLVTKPHNKTPYELFLGRKPALSFMRPFRCPVTILNIIDHLGKFDDKANEGFFVGYSINSKDRMEIVPGKDYILLPLLTTDLPFSQSSKSSPDAGFKPLGDDEKKVTAEPGKGVDPINVVGRKASIKLLDNSNMPALEDIVYSDDDEVVGLEADMNNLDAFMSVSPIPTTRIHKDHPFSKEQTIKTFKTTCLLAFYHKKNPKGNSCIKGSKLDRDYARRASIIQVTRSLDLDGFTKWQKAHRLDFPDKGLQVEKALYGLHQAPRAWYETLSTYLLENGFQRGQIDQTLFIKRDQGDILIVQGYIDDIIFWSKKKKLCTEFEKMSIEVSDEFYG
ncbi:putative ribonuclease H-like domain-containing protein [Tanacetum coccineum]